MSISYPLDLDGINPANLVTNELHTVSGGELGSSSFIVPNFGPFYADDFEATIIINDIERPLVEGVDFEFAVQYVAGTRKTGKPVFGALTITDLDRRGIIRLDKYRTLGGNQIVDRLTILTALAEKVYNPRTTWFDNLTNLPAVFPPERHAHLFDEVMGQQGLIDKLHEIRDAILDNSSLTQAEIRRFLELVGETSLSNVLSVTGGTMAGDLVLAGNPQTPRSAVPRDWVYSNFVQSTDFTSMLSNYASNQQVTQLANNTLMLTGGAMSGPIILHADPVEDSQASTKRYVDQKFRDIEDSVSDLAAELGSIGSNTISREEVRAMIDEVLVRLDIISVSS